MRLCHLPAVRALGAGVRQRSAKLQDADPGGSAALFSVFAPAVPFLARQRAWCHAALGRGGLGTDGNDLAGRAVCGQGVLRLLASVVCQLVRGYAGRLVAGARAGVCRATLAPWQRLQLQASAGGGRQSCCKVCRGSAWSGHLERLAFNKQGDARQAGSLLGGATGAQGFDRRGLAVLASQR